MEVNKIKSVLIKGDLKKKMANQNLAIQCASDGNVYFSLMSDAEVNTSIQNNSFDATKFVDAATISAGQTLAAGQWMCVPAYSAHLHQGPNQSPEVV